MIPNFSFEASLPRSIAWWLVIEYVIIPFIPNGPNTYHEDFHEKRLFELLISKEDFVMDIGVLIPLNIKSKPANNHRGAIKNKCSIVSSIPLRHRGQL
jgi:hypothetical protein